MKSSLRKEAEKIGSRDLGEYWLATSATASPNSKLKISEVFARQGLRPENVLAREDIENLLDQHGAVERLHVKLYVSSLSVLKSVLHHAVYERQRFFLDRADKQARLFVSSDATARVHDSLSEHGMAIITGPPGVGKTTLAESVALAYSVEGYEIFDVRDASEIENAWQPGEKQLFLYDDFLGQTSLMEKLSRGEDHSLDILAKRLSDSKSHKMILTTREYILTAAQNTYSKLRSATVLRSNVVVDVSTYSSFQRAHILYNHIFYSGLGRAARNSITENSRFLRIMAHPNYNPRLIESIVTAAQALGGEACGSGFADYMLDALRSPSALWTDVFDVELTSSQRALALSIALGLSGRSKSESLRVATRVLAAWGRPPLIDDSDIDVLEGIFVSTDRDDDGSVVLSAKNPGIRDFLLLRIFMDARAFETFLRWAPTNSVLSLLLMLTGRGVLASRPWQDLKLEHRVALLRSVSENFTSLLERAEGDDGLRLVAIGMKLLQSNQIESAIAPVSRVLGLTIRFMNENFGVQARIQAYAALEPLLSVAETELLAEEVRRAWTEHEIDFDDIPSAHEFEVLSRSGLEAHLESELIERVEAALDDPDWIGYDSDFEMLHALQRVLESVPIGESDIHEQLQERLIEAWEPDPDDEYEPRAWNRPEPEDLSEVEVLFRHL